MNPRDMNSGFQAVVESSVAGPRLKEESHETGREETNRMLVNPGKRVKGRRYCRTWAFGIHGFNDNSSGRLNSLEGQQPATLHQPQLPQGGMKLPGTAAWDSMAKPKKPL